MEFLVNKLRQPNESRIFYIGDALRLGMGTDQIHALTSIDRWFLENIKEIIDFEAKLKESAAAAGDLKSKLTSGLLKEAKGLGFSDKQLAKYFGGREDEIRQLRKENNIHVAYKLVDTCAAEFEAYTPYYYSTYESEDEARPGDKKKVMILGGGPNRIGQGIEFDYCCVHASFALKEAGFETIMVNCNPETVSTDYDTSDKLYFEPMTKEDVLNIVDKEKPWA
jgi:carbamoyl-phosphate synthase large subunit